MIGEEMGKRGTLTRLGALGPTDDEGDDGGRNWMLQALGWTPRFDLRNAVVDAIDWVGNRGKGR